MSSSDPRRRSYAFFDFEQHLFDQVQRMRQPLAVTIRQRGGFG